MAPMSWTGGMAPMSVAPMSWMGAVSPPRGARGSPLCDACIWLSWLEDPPAEEASPRLMPAMSSAGGTGGATPAMSPIISGGGGAPSAAGRGRREGRGRDVSGRRAFSRSRGDGGCTRARTTRRGGFGIARAQLTRNVGASLARGRNARRARGGNTIEPTRDSRPHSECWRRASTRDGKATSAETQTGNAPAKKSSPPPTGVWNSSMVTMLGRVSGGGSGTPALNSLARACAARQHAL